MCNRSTKICVLCGKEFTPTSNAQRICKDDHFRKCEVCGKLFKISRPSDTQLCCSKECTQVKRSRTMVERYGVEHALQNKELLSKAEATSIQLFGTKYASQSDDVKSSVRKHFQDKFGVDTPFQMDDFQEKRRATCLEKYGQEHPLRSEYSLSKMREHYSETCSERFGVPYACLTKQCQEANPGLKSSMNINVHNMLNELGIQNEMEFRLEDKSFDICILDRHILLEINPTYTHSVDDFNHWHTSVSSNYHLEKTELANRHGYRCIHIFDWDNLNVVLSTVIYNRSVFARKCKVVDDVSSDDAKRFLTSNHIQGDCRGKSINLGLYYEDELVELMSFGAPRYTKRYDFELLRLCTKSGMSVVGGAAKLFKHFSSSNQDSSVISYCDRAKFSGDVYTNMGFQLNHVTEPNLVWSKGLQKVTNNLLISRGYDQLFGTNYGKGTSNELLMIEHGWHRVYDCGQMVFTYGT